MNRTPNDGERVRVSSSLDAPWGGREGTAVSTTPDPARCGVLVRFDDEPMVRAARFALQVLEPVVPAEPGGLVPSERLAVMESRRGRVRAILQEGAGVGPDREDLAQLLDDQEALVAEARRLWLVVYDPRSACAAVPLSTWHAYLTDRGWDQSAEGWWFHAEREASLCRAAATECFLGDVETVAEMANVPTSSLIAELLGTRGVPRVVV